MLSARFVVPLVGTWIEIENTQSLALNEVVPLVGTWIEMVFTYTCGV